MPPDHRFDRLLDLATPRNPGSLDESTLPPEVFEAWRAGGLRFGRFVLLGELGRGGTGIVYRAWQHDLRREVALKVVTGLNPELRERFMREARVGAALAHETILPVYETGEADGALWLAMPLVKGKPLDECGLDAMEAARVVAAAARGVQAAHEAGVIHRDLKPRNIMREAGGAVRVMDFGLALTRDDATRISVTGQVLGTPAYMSPEQAAGRAADARTDVYGLGATLYRLVSGRSPYECGSLQEFLAAVAARDPEPPSRFSAIPADLETVILQAMDRDPARRYPSAAALAADLESFARGEPISARPASVATRAWRGLKRRRLWIALGAAGLVLATGGLVLGMYGMKSGNRNAPPVESVESSTVQAEKALDAARQFRQNGRPAEALAAYEEAQRRFPEYWKCWADCGEYRRELRDFKRADGDLTRALELRPTDYNLIVLRGDIRLGAADFVGAEADFDRAIRLDPAAVEGYLGRSRVHAIRKDWQRAKEDCTTAVNLDPRNLWARRSRAALLYQSGDFAGAVRDWDEAIRQYGEGAPFLRARANAKLRARDFAGAVADYEKAVKLNPDLASDCEAEIREARAGLNGENGK